MWRRFVAVPKLVLLISIKWGQKVEGQDVQCTLRQETSWGRGPRAQVIHFRCVYSTYFFQFALLPFGLLYFHAWQHNMNSGGRWGQCHRKWIKSRKQMKSRLCTFWNSWFLLNNIWNWCRFWRREVTISVYVGCIRRVQIWWGSVAFAVRVAVALPWWGVQLHYLSYLV